jgi:glycogen debranching enzyme
MKLPVRNINWPERVSADPESIHSLEWLVTNGIGGYASGTVSGLITRRYHGYLIAAMPVPLGRMMMLTHLSERIGFPDGSVIRLFDEEYFYAKEKYREPGYLKEFRLEGGLPVWTYGHNGFLFEKRVLLPYRQNTVHVIYELIKGKGTLKLKLRPSMNIRHHELPVNTPLAKPYVLKAIEGRFEITAGGGLPALRMFITGTRTGFTVEEHTICQIQYSVEESRGYECAGDLWIPGYFRVNMEKDKCSALVASTEPWETCQCLTPDEALKSEYERREKLITAAATHPLIPSWEGTEGWGVSSSSSHGREGRFSELILAADQFIITPAGRTEDAARARAARDEVRSIIAGYHWFTDWGRDTMISLEGLALLTGRHLEAGYILRTFAHYIRDGLIPNMFPEADREGLYNTADATLWFFHAIERYIERTGDQVTLQMLLPKLEDVIEHHLKGTLFGIGADPTDGLLREGAQGYQLTWMDAKVGDRVVTPRRGKPVEINALWYNALKLMEKWTGSSKYAGLAEKAWDSFNSRFWYAEGNYLYDVVDGEDGDDTSLRPNQIFAISLPHPVLENSKWEAVLSAVKEKLLTPAGLRTLAPGHPDYKSTYSGDLRSRDAAYHQGTVWPWLIGPFVDAWLKVYPEEREKAASFLDGLFPQLGEAGMGSLSEVYNAEPPHTPGGCIAQAWSIAEALRALVKISGVKISQASASPVEI